MAIMGILIAYEAKILDGGAFDSTERIVYQLLWLDVLNSQGFPISCCSDKCNGKQRKTHQNIDYVVI